MNMYLGATDIKRGNLLALGAFNKGGPSNDHVRLLGHVHTVRDHGHIAAASDAVAEHAS